MSSQDGNIQYALPGYGVETDFRQQVVAVGTPLPTASLPFGKSLGMLFIKKKIKNNFLA